MIKNEISAMISDQDLQKANLALKVSTNVIQANNTPAAHQAVIGMAIQASSSELIQGNMAFKDTIKRNAKWEFKLDVEVDAKQA